MIVSTACKLAQAIYNLLERQVYFDVRNSSTNDLKLYRFNLFAYVPIPLHKSSILVSVDFVKCRLG